MRECKVRKEGNTPIGGETNSFYTHKTHYRPEESAKNLLDSEGAYS